MSFIAAHGLPWSAVDDLLKLVDALFGFQRSGLPQSKYLLRKLWSAKCASVVKYHYCCSQCGKLLHISSDKALLSCNGCLISTKLSDMKSGGTFFSILDLRTQFSSLIARLSSVLYNNLLKLKQQAEDGSRMIRDLTSGTAHRSLFEKGVLRWSDLTITLNTDGSPLYKSSNSSIWPIQMIVNELPTSHRHKNVVLGGLWFGRKHPDMLLFLEKFVEAMGQIGELIWKHCSSVIHTKVYTMCLCVDAPARAAVGNQVQFNGFFGCPWCLACGESQEGRLLYTHSKPDVERTSAGIRRDMSLAASLKTPVNGLKGLSPLTELPHFDLVWGYTVEYMHCVLLGVVRQFTDYWFDSSNNNEAYYIGRPRTLELINRRLLSIRPPHHFTRLPRTLRERCYWKAHEWRNWLLFYCLPCCRHALPPKYLRHFSLLAEAIFVLLLEELSSDQIDYAEKLLTAFVSQAASLYGQRCMSFNTHQLLHLAEAARKFGPLWAHSAFTFESGNGELVRLVNAAKAVPEQILERVIMSQELHVLLSKLPLPSDVLNFCTTILGNPNTQHARRIGAAWMFGTPKDVVSLSDQEFSCLQVYFGHVPSVQEHLRFSYIGTIFHSANYRAGRKNSSVFECNRGGFYAIKRIFEVTDSSSTSNGQAVLLCTKIVTDNNVEGLPPYVSECFFISIFPVTTEHHGHR
ncbi:uncharacterized protein LOC125942543 isoform X1 [Dermacentor silvarum]|uniref:uncharacterized protein LOC125942543 isoform X1 n=1 Tax=Dermacentor silvarum TaxID=543639 RepID=UPI0021011BD4|nr:uncharacterized protein LOC125942543 isoform X1 [Dermacentor silvarum]